LPTAEYGIQPVKTFGGLITNVDPTNLPVWASPDCQDVEFLPGLVRSRPGLSTPFSPIGGGTVKVNYLKTYINSLLQDRMLALTPGIASLSNSGAVLYKENPEGTLNIVSQSISSNYCSSCSAFTREYLAFGDGSFGVDIPRQFDDANLDRVSQEGPGVAPGAADESVNWAIAAAPNGAIAQSASIPANGLTQSGYVVTLTLLPSNNGTAFSKVGDSIQITGAGVAGYNGTWTISAIISATQIQYVASTSGLAPSGGGTCNFGIVQYVPSSGSVPTSYSDGQIVTVAGVAVGGYNVASQVIRGNIFGGTPGTGGSYPVGSTSIFVYLGTGAFGLAASGGGTVTNAGNVVAGVHQVSVIFVTRNGYLTRPAPANKWTAAGSKRVVVSNIPIGPPNVISRIVCFTPAGGDNFFYTTGGLTGVLSASMVIADNTTTAITLDFSDATLLAGTNVDALFDLNVLGECSGNVSYSSRLFWWGERNQLQNLLNVGFDGGFTNPGSLPNFPHGWVQDATFSAGGASALAQGYPAYSGDAYAIVGNGVTPTRGKITQSLYQDADGNAILSVNTGYSIRVRLAKNSTLAAGTLHINAKSTTGGFTTTGISVTSTQLATWYQEFTAVLLTAQATIPSDLVLQIYADGTPTNNGAFLIDCIEIYPTNQPNSDASTVRASKVEDPESYDGVTGFLQVAQGDGTRVTSAFVIRNNLYFAKERSLYVTQDDGVNEPSSWDIQQISSKVGTPSVKGIGLGDEWAVIAAQDGVYLFDGGIPQKISQEIQPTWDAINWTYGYLVETVVDVRRKRIYISVPYGSATAPNKILTLDYTEGFGELQDGVGRKWSPWAIQANSMNLILRSDGTLPLFLGNGAGNGAIYKLDDTVHSDDGAAINSYWQSGYFQSGIRMNYGYIAANVVGSGNCNLTLLRGDQTNVTVLRSWTLSSLGYTNMERQIQKQGYRMAIKFGTDAAGDNFSLQGFTIYAAKSPYAPVRGINA